VENRRNSEKEEKPTGKREGETKKKRTAQIRQMKSIGIHVLMDLFACKRELLEDPPGLEDYLKSIVAWLKLRFISSHSYLFSPFGYSIFILIAESHLTFHTFPEHHFAAFDLFSCRELEEDKIKELEIRLKRHFDCIIQRKTISRGQGLSSDESQIRIDKSRSEEML